MPLRKRARRRDEAGAVAVLTAILAVLLLSVAALSVDIGNSWARKRAAQTQADVAAISAMNWAKDQNPQLVPADTGGEQTQIISKLAEYMIAADNKVTGQSNWASAAALATALGNADPADGHVVFTHGGTEMQVTTPPATVQFGMAAVMGYSSVDVRADATVGLFSEVPGADVMPLYVPNGCSFGAVEADTGGGPPADVEDFALESMAPATAAEGATVEVTITVAKNKLTNNQPAVVRFQSDATEFESSVTPTTSGNTATLDVSINSENVTAQDSTWAVTVSGKNGTVSGAESFTVGAGTPVEDPGAGCAGPNQGKFGQLNSPRKGLGLTKRNERLELNMLEGLDHNLFPYLNAPTDSCEDPGGQTGAQFDNDANRDGNNCIKGDQGNDGPSFAKALIDDGGRLNASNGQTKSGCGRSNDGAFNNDVISCFLRDDATAFDIAQATATEEMLDPSIVDSPRFVWIPVVYATDRALNDYQPILKFVPGLITSETTAETADQFDAANPSFHNGLECNGNSWPCNSLSRIKIFTFNPAALPDSADSPVIEYDPDVGEETVRLID